MNDFVPNKTGLRDERRHRLPIGRFALAGRMLATGNPDLVKAIVSVEPMGPPFVEIPNIGPLSWGRTASPLTFDPPRASPEEVRAAEPASLKLSNLAGLPRTIQAVLPTHGCAGGFLA